MSVPALRQPKLISQQQETRKKSILPDTQYVIVTLKGERKLVVSSDSYHGIITVGEMYTCVFCKADMELETNFKEKHKNSASHRKQLEKYPHIEAFAENLVRELSKDTAFCTICTVAIPNIHLSMHLSTSVHTQELQKATIRAATYKPH